MANTLAQTGQIASATALNYAQAKKLDAETSNLGATERKTDAQTTLTNNQVNQVVTQTHLTRAQILNATSQLEIFLEQGNQARTKTELDQISLQFKRMEEKYTKSAVGKILRMMSYGIKDSGARDMLKVLLGKLSLPTKRK
jgi:hypothetical protein